MSDYPFKPPADNPFSAKKQEPAPDPLNRVEQVIVAAATAPAPKAASIPKPKGPLPTLTMEEKSCRTCEYYEFDEKMERLDAYKGQCRRHAPTPGSEGQAFWPEVPWKGWCGEWESGVSNEDMVRMARDIGESINEESDF